MTITLTSLAVTGIGVASSLGVGHRGACAAARAGLSRAVELGIVVRSEVDGDDDVVVGSPVGSFTVGFTRNARLVRLATLALEDLGAGGLAERVRDRRVGLCVVLPHDWTPGPDPDEDADEEPPVPVTYDPGWIAERVTGALASRPVATTPIRDGRVGLASALDLAHREIAASRWDAAIVVASDSLVEEEVVEHLHARGRLKCAGFPTGLQPGEAAVALLLEAEGAPTEMGRVSAIARGDAPYAFGSGDVPDGRACAELVEMLAGSLGSGLGRPQLYPDLNGEIGRATEWGYLLCHLAHRHPWLGDALHLPIASFGDAGVAAGALAVATCLRELDRAPRSPETGLIMLNDDEGPRALVAVSHTRR